jgi:hypothetical protein
MAWPIKRIIYLMESRDGRACGFRITRCSDGKSVEGFSNQPLGNLLRAFTHDGTDFVRDYYYYMETVSDRELNNLPEAPWSAEDLREFVKREFRKRKAGE